MQCQWVTDTQTETDRDRNTVLPFQCTPEESLTLQNSHRSEVEAEAEAEAKANMEKSAPSPSPPSPSQSSLRELECVGRLEITRPEPVGFLCGSIPVPTDKSFHAAALVPSPPPPLPHAVSAPRYRMLPTETDLNTLPVVSNLPEKVLPIGAAAVQSKFTTGELSWESENASSNLSRKCEALAISGLVEYGDEIDVIAAADILKQIFKMPYSKARLSIAVRRIGQTLVLNTGPDVEEGEKLVRRHNNQSKCADHSLFLNFAMHSVRMEACDCPPTHHTSSESNSPTLHGGDTSQFVGQCDDVATSEEFNHCSKYSQVKQDGLFWENKKSKRNKGRHPVKKSSHLGENPRGSMQESENHRRVSNDGFLRVLLWQFHNFRMLLGSDLLLFSNEKYVAVSLHLWDVSRQVTPLTWLEAWLDNVMASVPELAICYHQDGVVQGYELIKTDDIFLLKGIAEDGTPAFHPHVVQQNGLAVLRFLQENCKQDPGAYWLYKNSGEDVIQLFDLSVIPKNHSSTDCDDTPSSLPPSMYRGRSDSLFSLGTLLYRIAHRLSLSLAPSNRAKCARFFQKCLEFLDEPDLLMVRAFAHEQFARLLLNHDESLELTSESLTSESEATIPMESLDTFNSFSESVGYENGSPLVGEGALHDERLAELEDSVRLDLEDNVPTPRELIPMDNPEFQEKEGVLPESDGAHMAAVCDISPTPKCAVQTVTVPITSKLAAVNHVSQAIKSLRWMRQLQSPEEDLLGQGSSTYDGPPSSIDLSVCACGDADCIEVCDIREWLPTSKIDHKLWKLVLLLGESYLALGQAYKEDKQLDQALKVVELACSLYGSMPQHLEDTKFVSSMVKYSSPRKFSDRNVKMISCVADAEEVNSCSNDNCLAFEHSSSTYLFWAKTWTLVGDVYVECHSIKGKELPTQAEAQPSARELRMSSEVVKEVLRLKRKLGQFNQNCSLCSLVNCSCQSDRACSGNSASSSSGDKYSVAYGRRHGKRAYAKGTAFSLSGDTEDDHVHHGVECRKGCDSGRLQHDDTLTNVKASSVAMDKLGINSPTESFRLVDSFTTHDTGSTLPSQGNTSSKGTPKVKNGGIFKYLGDSFVGGDVEYNLYAALSCYSEAKKALGGLPKKSEELQSVVRKIGWVYNEMGRNRLERKELAKAELAFADATSAFREVSDHTNIILINCNLGHGRRALAEDMVSKIETLKLHTIFRGGYKQALQTAKLEYSESLRYYGAAKSELSVAEETHPVPISLRNEVFTQYAHTYLRLGMLLAKEDTCAEVYETGALDDISVVSPSDKRARKEVRKREISANDAIRDALSLYESLGELRKQETAYAYFHLACYQRDCCLKFLEENQKKSNLAKCENSIFQRVKQYASLADRNWQRAMEFYGPKTHATMHLTILIERSALSLCLSSSLHSNAMLESALGRMLEGRHTSETTSSEVHTKFWGQLQMLLKKMLASTLATNPKKSSGGASPSPASNRHGDAAKIRELYKMSLQCTDLSRLHAMHSLWTS